MCGIAGYQGKFSKLLLTQMNNLQKHRGPDDHALIELQGTHKTGLAHQRLSIIDLSSAGKQPMTVKCAHCQPNTAKLEQKIWLTYNGELYNYQILKAELIAKGHQFCTQTDSEILIHLYAEYGIKMLSKLEGIFAFAIYDGRKNGQKDPLNPGDLLIVRDQYGIKPLYYTQTPKGFLFASEIKALLCEPTVSREIDPAAIEAYVSYLWCPGPHTAFKNIQKLLPGHATIIRNNQPYKSWQYYALPVPSNTLQFTKSFNDAAIELSQHIESAVSKQLISDVPVGAFLSGGLDSSSIVAMMRKLNPTRQIECFTIKISGKSTDGFNDDLPYAQQVAKDLNISLHTVEANPSIITRLPEMLYHLDEPQADPAPINALLICELAKKHGVKVLLSGAGGDDIFTGYRRHAAIHYQQYWRHCPIFLRQIISKFARHMQSGCAIGMNTAILRRATKLLAYCDQQGDDLLESYFYWNTSQSRRQLFNPEFFRPAKKPIYKLSESLKDFKSQDLLTRMLCMEMAHFLPDHNLNYTDKMSMASGIEVRVPLLDQELVKFAFQLPSHYKQRGKTGKAIFKKAMEPYLPQNIIYRPKTGFGAPIRHWMQHELTPVIHEYLSNATISNRGWFEPQAVQKLIKQTMSGRADGSYTLFSLLCIELWAQQFIDQAIPKPLLL